MPTGACGINCDICRLNVNGTCSSCGPGTSPEAKKKLQAQEKLLGQPCPILACASLNRIQFCLRDCPAFPCDNFSTGPYPFSDGFLNMQRRRRAAKPPLRAPLGEPVEIPDDYWDQLKAKNQDELCESAGCLMHPDGLQLRFLHLDLLVHFNEQRLYRLVDGDHEPLNDDYLELITLFYLLNATAFSPRGEWVGVKDLKTASFFRGPHELKTDGLIKRFGRDIEGFRKAAAHLGGKPIDMGDAACRLLPFPKIPVTIVLWEGDDEFPPAISVLFDRSIERHLPADAIWGMVALVAAFLVVNG